jgi:hypothetical protein
VVLYTLTMATFMEPKFPISKNQRKLPHRNNATLEDVAEEILNGILCQYEPPNREKLEFQKRYPSILRRPKDKRMQNLGKATSISASSKKQRVRWSDEHKNEEDATDGTVIPPSKVERRAWSVAEACFDAGVEVGCVNSHNSQYTDSNDDMHSTKQMMNAKEAIAVARAKSPRNHIKEELIFDDDGNPTYAKANLSGDPVSPKISLPSEPPPPSKKERFFPELCGVRINCGEEEAYFHVMSRSTKDMSDSLHCGQDDENLEDDYDNSLVDYNDDSDSASDNEQVPKKKDRPRASSQGMQRSQRRGEPTTNDKPKRTSIREIIDNYLEQDVDNTDWEGMPSPTSSSTNVLRRVWPRHKDKPRPTVRNALTEKEYLKSDSAQRRGEPTTKDKPKRTSVREIIDNYFEQDVDDTDWELRRVWPRHKDKPRPTVRNALTEKEYLKSDSDDDERNPKQRTAGRRGSSRSRSPSRRDPDKQNTKSVAIHDVYESIEMVNKEPKDVKKTSLGAKLKSMVANKSPRSLKKLWSSPSTISMHGGSSGDWDESLPIVPGLMTAEKDTTTVERLRSSQIIPPTTAQINPYSSSIHQHAQPPTRNPQMYPQLHPAHPLVSGPQELDRNDRLERQSFITAHRHVFDHTKNAPVINDDDLERQSFIGAYRNGIEGTPTAPLPAPNTLERLPPITEHPTAISSQTVPNPPNYYPSSGYGPRTHDDAFERQSFISAHRQGFDARAPHKSGLLSHDDVMERMSYITAYRQGIDPLTIYNTDSGVKSFPPHSKQKQRSRSRSPYRRNRSYDSINDGTESHRMPRSTPEMFNPAIPIDPHAMNAFLPTANCNNLPQYNPNGVYANYGPYQLPAAVAGDLRAGNEATPSTAVQIPAQEEQNISSAVVEQQDEPELTWEERTRQAWERIRGGISALTFENTSEEKSDGESNKDNAVNGAGVVDSMNQLQSLQQNQLPEANNAVQPTQCGIPQYSELQPHELAKRVSFGEPQQMIYYDDQDENRSTMSLPARTTRKKMKFRGAKLVGGVLGKVKNSLTKVSSLSRSLSSDTHVTLNSGKSSYSTEWEGPVYYSNYSPRSAYGTRQYGPGYSVNAMNPVMERNAQHELNAPSYHVNPETLQPSPQYYQYQGIQQNVMQPISQNHLHQPPMYSSFQANHGYSLQNSKIFNYAAPQNYAGPTSNGNSRRSL